MVKNRKIFIFEFDGGSWDVIEPLLSEGKLPNLKRLMDEGSYGILYSDTPTISPRIWSTIFTGKNSSKHGVEFFASTSSNVKQKRLWDILNDRGLKVGIFGSLVTWPPYPVNGFMIPSIFSLGPETYPEDYQVLQEIAVNERKKMHKGREKGISKYFMYLLNMASQLKAIGVTRETLRSALLYLITEKLFHLPPKERYWRKASIHFRMTVDVFINLYKHFQPDFVTFHNHLCDAVSHRYWDCYEPQHFKDLKIQDIKKYNRVIPDSYIMTDKMLGLIISHLDPRTTIFIISDHGSKALPNTIKPYSLNFDNLLRILQIQDRVIPARFGLKSLLYFTDGLQKDRYMETLRSISLDKTGERIFDVESNEQYISLCPVPHLWRQDIPVDSNVRIDGFGIYPFSEIFMQQRLKITGIHHKEGIFIASGPTIKKGIKPDNASVFDITPTVLAVMGFPVAEDMDGRVITEIIDEEVLSETPVRKIETYENGIKLMNDKKESVDIEKIKERLSSLGYL